MIHPNEPKLEELKEIWKKLMISKSTDEDLKKLKALESQIRRHEDARKEVREAIKKAEGLEKSKKDKERTLNAK